jgi:hypothetical protein
VFELLLPVALGVLGGGIGLALAGRSRKSRQEVLEEADALQAQGASLAAVALLERALRQVGPTETAFIAEARYRLCGLYVSLQRWRLGEQVCQELLQSASELGPSGRHDVLRHLARCQDALGLPQEADASRSQADALIEEIPDTAYRLFARQERLVRLHQYPQALLLQEELLTSYPERVAVPTLLCFTAFTAQHAGYAATARSYLTQALATPELAPTLQWEMHRVGFHAAEAQHDWEALLAHAKALYTLFPKAASQRYLASALLLNNQLSEAEALLKDDDIGLGVTLARLQRDFPKAKQLLEHAAPGPKTTLLAATIALEAGDGSTALMHLEDLKEKSPLVQLRRAWALALTGITEPPPPPDETTPELLEAYAQALRHQGARTQACEAQAQLLRLPLAPAFRAYHEALYQQWTATP